MPQKKFPKNYDPMARQAQVEMDEVYQLAQAEIDENSNTVEFIEDNSSARAIETTKEQSTEQTELPPFMTAE